MDQILSWICIAVGSALFVYATIGRLCGFHRSARCQGGAQVGLIGDLSISIFVLCFGLAVHSPAWIILALVAFILILISQNRADKEYAAQEDKLRRANSSKYPGVFDNPPPDDINSVDEDELDLFDAGACTYLGRVGKKDIIAVIDQFKNLAEQGSNDIFMLEESLLLLPKESVSKEFRTLLEKAFEKRDFLDLRWMPLSRTGKSTESQPK